MAGDAGGGGLTMTASARDGMTPDGPKPGCADPIPHFLKPHQPSHVPSQAGDSQFRSISLSV
jgi:hypothetical protein